MLWDMMQHLCHYFKLAETLNRLRDKPFAEKLPIKGTYDVRNFMHMIMRV